MVSKHTINNFIDNFIPTSIFEEIGTENYQFTNAVNIHPNPTNNHVSVDLGKDYQTTNFTLKNSLGQIILKQQVNTSNEFHFEIQGVAGLYLLEIETDAGEKALFKILKN